VGTAVAIRITGGKLNTVMCGYSCCY